MTFIVPTEGNCRVVTIEPELSNFIQLFYKTARTPIR